MTRHRPCAVVLVASLIVAAGIAPARSCGFDGVFDGNFGVSHPLAMAVAVAMRRAVVDEVMPAEAAAPIVAGAAGLWQTTARIHALARALSRAAPREAEGFVLHLADSGLWARLEPSPEGLAAEIHVDGPRPDETILVTHGAVLERLVDARMTVRQAADRGLIVFAGREAGIEAITRRFVMLDQRATAPAGATASAVSRARALSVIAADWRVATSICTITD